jgi:predicted PurR-regulated permease PerM
MNQELDVPEPSDSSTTFSPDPSEVDSGTKMAAVSDDAEFPNRVLAVVASGSKWDAATKRTVLVLLLIAGVILIWISRSILPILVIAGVIAYLLSPIVGLLERLRVPRAVSTGILFVLLLLLVILLPIFLTPVLISQLASLNFDVQLTAFRTINWLADTINNLPDSIELGGFVLPLTALNEQIEAGLDGLTLYPTVADALNYLQQVVATATSLVTSTAAISFSLVGSVISFLISFIVLFFVSLYWTKDAPAIRAYIEGLFPQSYQSELVDLLRRIGYTWQSFLRGQLVLSFVIFLATWLVLSLVGMPGALLLAILAGLLEVIPNLGPIIAMIPAVIIAMIQGSDVLAAYGIGNFGFALITIAIYFIVQQLENNILVPRIIGGVVNLHPIVVICGVMVGYQLAGILGALFAAPVLATIRTVGSYIYAKLLDEPPFQGQELPPKKPPRSDVYRRIVTGEELALQDKTSEREARMASLRAAAVGAGADIDVDVDQEREDTSGDLAAGTSRQSSPAESA